LDVSPFKVAVPTAGLLLVLELLLVLSAGVFWFMYLANGIAYGSIVGLHGREADLRTLGVRAETSLAAAVVVQAIGVGLVVSVFTAELPSVAESRMLRLLIPIALGFLSSAVVFVAIRDSSVVSTK
jgi:hypothetical protein